MRSVIFLLMLSLITARVSAQANHPVTWKFDCVKVGALTYKVQFHAAVKEPFHIYPMQSSGGGLGMPTEFIFEDDENIELTGDMEERGVDAAVGDVAHYAVGATFTQTIRLRSDKKTTLRFRIKYMACTDSYCLPPSSKKFTFDISEQGGVNTESEGEKGNQEKTQDPVTWVYEDFVMQDTARSNVSSREITLKSRYTFIDFWASWCGPCRAQGRHLVPVYKQYRQKGFEVIGISLDTDAKAWKKAILADGYPWTNLSDLKGFESPVSKKYGITEIPRNFLIDSSGVIVAKDLHGKELERKLAELLDK
ncbi:peroxiredoxin family protein [Pseudoflavitalea rhizosphaerae]|uniref:peroxiredoxin family protein n=1 Tax=Pseudoflavitalea rhizosphaerae TaxID=1884793 RepID=UPI000F8D5691|nr:TlpA disulfide reductase family protein [Pseudoflavitalea rhizosphaerae]